MMTEYVAQLTSCKTYRLFVYARHKLYCIQSCPDLFEKLKFLLLGLKKIKNLESVNFKILLL